MQEKPLICIIGAGRTGRLLLEKLKDNWSLLVIDKDPEKLKLAKRLVSEKNNDVSFDEIDATSQLQLERSSISRAFHILVMINDDEAVMEISKILTTRFDRKNIVARISSDKYASRLKNMGIQVITPFETIANLVLNQINLGEIIALNIGKGEGEIVQVELTKSSPLIGKKLRDLPPKQWIIGAIYRPTSKLVLKSPSSYLKGFQISKEDQLIIPDGNTTPKAGDKLILIGDPHILRATAQYLKAGAPVFPVRHGDNVVVVIPDKITNMSTYREFKWLLQAMEPVKLNYLFFNDDVPEKLKRIKYPAAWPEEYIKNINFQATTYFSLTSQIKKIINNKEVGLIITRKSGNFFLRMIQTYWYLPRLVSAARDTSTPVWIIQGEKPVKNINLYVSGHEEGLRVTELAIDAAKKFNFNIKSIQIIPPSILTGDSSARQLEETMRSVHEIAAMYGIFVTETRYTGNPVFEALKNLQPDELLVLPYPVDSKRGFLMPPITEKLLFKKYKGSILVLPV